MKADDPRRLWVYKDDEDIDRDDIFDAVVRHKDGKIVAVNGYQGYNSAWNEKSIKKYTDKYAKGAKNRESIAPLNAIRKRFGDLVIKPIYKELIQPGSGLHKILPFGKLVMIAINVIAQKSGLEDRAWDAWGADIKAKGLSHTQGLAFIHSQPQYRAALVKILTPFAAEEQRETVKGLITEIVQKAIASARRPKVAAAQAPQARDES
jgi:hypothetical protein